jgi:hypothetical protein
VAGLVLEGDTLRERPLGVGNALGGVPCSRRSMTVPSASRSGASISSRAQPKLSISRLRPSTKSAVLKLARRMGRP